MPIYSLTGCAADLFPTFPLIFQECAQEGPMDKGESRVSIKPLTRASRSSVACANRSLPATSIAALEVMVMTFR